MKKNLLMVAVMAILSVAAAVAQPRAIGGRLGYGVEFSYEHGLGNNMLSIDAGLLGLGLNHHYGVEGVVTYDWINPGGHDFPTVSKGDWNWYAGVGGGAGAHFSRIYQGDVVTDEWHNHYFVGVAGRIGVEYNFWFPLQLSLDFRPVIGPTFCGYRKEVREDVAFNLDGLYYGGIALGVRYKF